MESARNSTTGTRAQTRTKVPVVSRTIGKKPQRVQRQPASKIDIAGYGILIAVSIIVLLAVTVPLNNFYSGRAEIARLNDAIIAKQAEKDRLLSEIEKYKSDSYIKQEARRRLGVVAPGETAYRILDPRMNHANTVTTDKEAEANAREWYTVLWDSVSTPPSERAVPAENGPANEQPVEDSAAEGAPAADLPGEAVPPAEMETQP